MNANEVTRRTFLAAASATAGGLLISGGRASAQPTSGVRMRREIRALSQDAAALSKLRNAFKELQALVGTGGYQELAGLHGEPKYLCPHGNSLFLPWHRAYILAFEDALQKIDATVTLPFWDWTSSTSIQTGIPEAYADRTYQLAGADQPNPLYSAKIDLLGRETRRNPRPPVVLGSYAGQVNAAFSETTFLDFSSSLYGPHGGLHTWVRGDMGSVPYAAYDPIFWAHHANVDRQWAQWQLGPNNEDPPSSDLGLDLEPFGKKVKDVIDYKGQLNYDYEGITPMPPRMLLLTDKGNLLELKGFEFDPKRQAVFLLAHDVQPSAESFNVDVFINQPDANEKTPLEGNPNYAGSFGIFGTGKQRAHGVHAKAKRTQRVLNVTAAMAKFAKADEKSSMNIKLVVTDMDGKAVDASKLPIKGVSVQPE